MVMGYEIAMERAWKALEEAPSTSEYAVPFLTEVYLVNLEERTISSTLGEPPRDDISILVLHYLIGIRKERPVEKEEWISFREIEGGISFLPAFEETVIKPLVGGFDRGPEGVIRNLLHRFGGRTVECGDVGVQIAPFPEVLVRIVFWKGDEEIPSQATILFDRSLAHIFTTEDIAVLLQLLVRRALEGVG
ncbi:DUF3786 domain-containing protein [Candidatus Methanocrinis natronophilus]|nr:DUF3786 domain-containing protein [Candidatus Methanocrinis natronophilus]